MSTDRIGHDTDRPAPADPLRVLQVGPRVSGPDSRGGIATVMLLILEHDDPSIRQAHIPTFGEGTRVEKLRVGVIGILRAAREICARRVDVVHVHMSYKGSVLRKGIVLRIAQAAGVPTVLHCHSHGFTRWYDGLPRPARFGVRHLLHADRWLVLGARWADEYAHSLGIDPARVSVLHNPAIAARVRPGETARLAWPERPAGGARILFLGRLGERKGCYDLVSALARLPRDLQDRVHVVMAGDGDVEGVRRAAEEAGVGRLVTFPGWIDETTRASLLLDGDVLALPSYQEGLPMAVLEGMGGGLAVVTTPVGGLPEVIEDGVDGLFHEPGDAGALADLLARLIQEPDTRERLGRRAAETAQRFDVTRWHAALTDIWHDTARRAAGRGRSQRLLPPAKSSSRTR